MILRELFYGDKDLVSSASDLRYTAANDTTAIKNDDTRKTKLTLKQINQLRKASEAHILEQEKELEFVKTMYFQPAAPAA